MKKLKVFYSDFLFPKSTTLTGMGSIFNIYGNYYEFNTSGNGDEADFRAIRSDFGMIGQDLIQAAWELEEENLEEVKHERKITAKAG